jgi:MoxR-like ATPase
VARFGSVDRDRKTKQHIYKHITVSSPDEIAAALRDEIGTVLIGNEEVVDGLTSTLLTRGHALLEGVPGVAKTMAANLFASATGLEFGRIQLTPDTLPADLTGTYVYREGTGEFELQKGPLFSNLIVADEINRATPKTQSALLEAMQEGTVTIEGNTHRLPQPFTVVATQNPIESEGTFSLPEAQRDRFQYKFEVGLLSEDHELELMNRFDSSPTLSPADIDQVVTPEELRTARHFVDDVYVSDPIKQYLFQIINGTRESQDVDHGASSRATLALMSASKAQASIQGRSYVIPDDVKRIATDVLAHRLVLSVEADLSDVSPREIVTDIVDSTAPPTSTSWAEQEESPEPSVETDRSDVSVEQD